MIRQKVDYGKYRYSQKEILKYIGESAALCGAVDYLFYQTPWVMLLVVPVSVVLSEVEEETDDQRKKTAP